MEHEGGYTDDPKDKGGATKFGVTLSTWIANGYDKDGDGDIDKQDIKVLDKADAYDIAKKLYWDKIMGDKIKDQSVAEFIFDWGYNSGPQTAIKKVQEILAIKIDGIIGPQTLKFINDADPKALFNKLKARREDFFRNIVHNDPSQEKFLRGWLNRNNSFTFHA